MDCVDEVAVLKREIGPIVDGEDHLTFDVLNRKMIVEPPPNGVRAEAIIHAVSRTGMRAEVWRDDAPSLAEGWFRKHRGRALSTGLSGLLVIVGFLAHAILAGGIWAAIGAERLGLAHQVPWPARIAYLLAILAALQRVLPKAWGSIRRLQPDMNLLMTAAVIGAIGIGDWFEAATVAFLFALSLTLESWSVGRARRAVAALMELTPLVARLKRADGAEEQVPPEQVPIGAHFVVMPGEKIPLDGCVVGGFSEVNQASITGESAPTPKQLGDPVFAGTINGDGALDVECTKAANDTTLARIVHMVAEAQSRRAPTEQWVERFARVYTPVVMGLAVAFMVVPPLLFGGHWGDWFYRSLVLLVIACPCALVISTPVSIVAALATAACNGILVKGGAYMEAPARLQAIAFDKTGTLTEGRPRVVEVVPLSGHDEKELLERVAAM
jgi:Cd2+/Zn2+-exporting ATPase